MYRVVVVAKATYRQTTIREAVDGLAAVQYLIGRNIEAKGRCRLMMSSSEMKRKHGDTEETTAAMRIERKRSGTIVKSRRVINDSTIEIKTKIRHDGFRGSQFAVAEGTIHLPVEMIAEMMTVIDHVEDRVEVGGGRAGKVADHLIAATIRALVQVLVTGVHTLDVDAVRSGQENG